jgi:hypothetical protein
VRTPNPTTQAEAEDRKLWAFGHKQEEVTGENCIGNEELRNPYSSPNIITIIKPRMRWIGHVAGMGEMINLCNIFVGNLEGKRPLRRSREVEL